MATKFSESGKMGSENLKTRLDKAVNNDEIMTLSPQSEFKNLQEFKSLFDEVEKNKGTINTPLGEVKVNMLYAWKHFKDNTYNVDRESIKMDFLALLKTHSLLSKMRAKAKKACIFISLFMIKIKIS